MGVGHRRARGDPRRGMALDDEPHDQVSHRGVGLALGVDHPVAVLFLPREPLRPGRIDAGVEDPLVARLGRIGHPEGDTFGGWTELPQPHAILELVASDALPRVGALLRHGPGQKRSCPERERGHDDPSRRPQHWGPPLSFATEHRSFQIRGPIMITSAVRRRGGQAWSSATLRRIILARDGNRARTHDSIRKWAISRGAQNRPARCREERAP